MNAGHDRFNGRFQLPPEGGDGPIEITDDGPWLCRNCGAQARVTGETYCTECGARMAGRRYAAFLCAVDRPRGPACLVDAEWKTRPALLPQVWYDAVDGTRRLTLLRPYSEATAAVVDELDVLQLAAALVDGLQGLHAQRLVLGALAAGDLVRRDGQWVLRRVDHLQRRDALSADDIRGDLTAVAALLEQISAIPRTTQRLDDVGAADDAAPTGLAVVLRDLRTGALTDVEQLAARVHALLAELTRPLMLQQHSGTRSDVGRVRGHNEDSLLTLQLVRDNDGEALRLGLFAVADGMGGHAAGERASGIALRALTEHVVTELLLPQLAQPLLYDAERVRQVLREAVQAANTAVYEQSRAEGNDMGTTLVAALVIGDRVTLANVGDSRAYLLRDAALQRLTKDHSLVQRLVDLGQIQPDDVYTHPQRNAITASIGDRREVRIDISAVQVRAGDVLLLCSDGQWEMTRDPAMAEMISTAADAQAAAESLITAANAAGGEDNISAVVVAFPA